MAPRPSVFVVLSVVIGVPLSVIACKEAVVQPSVSASGGASAAPPSRAQTSEAAANTASAQPILAEPIPAITTAAPPAEPAAKPLSAAACNAIVERSAAGFRAALGKTKSTCASDADCIQERATCLPGCGGTAFAAKDKDAYAKAAAGPLAECKQFWDGGCSAALALPIPSCPQYLPVCDKGACVSKMRTK